MKRLILLSFYFLCSIMALAEFSGTKTDEQGVRYTRKDGTTCFVSGHEENHNTKIIIPEIFEGHRVTIIGADAFRNCTNLAEITIPNSVTSINRYAFRNCSKLTSITIGNSVTTIEKSAFQECSSLTSMIISNSVTSIGQYAFKGCSNLVSLTIGKSMKDIWLDAFEECINLSTITFYCQEVGEWFSNNKTIKNVVFGEGVKTIKHYAFDKCSGLTSATIGNTVEEIGISSFRGCSGLTSVAIGNGVKEIKYVFPGCTSLTSVTIPESVTTLEGAFSGCSNLTSITISNSVTNIGKKTFYNCSALTSITIPKSVTNIGDNAFSGCNKLHSIISLIENPTEIGGAFSEGTFKNATLYVPTGTIDLNKKTCGWKDYMNIVEGVPNGISSLKHESRENKKFYNINGQCVESQPKMHGIYIINGKKVFIK